MSPCFVEIYWWSCFSFQREREITIASKHMSFIVFFYSVCIHQKYSLITHTCTHSHTHRHNCIQLTDTYNINTDINRNTHTHTLAGGISHQSVCKNTLPDYNSLPTTCRHILYPPPIPFLSNQDVHTRTHTHTHMHTRTHAHTRTHTPSKQSNNLVSVVNADFQMLSIRWNSWQAIPLPLCTRIWLLTLPTPHPLTPHHASWSQLARGDSFIGC